MRHLALAFVFVWHPELITSQDLQLLFLQYFQSFGLEYITNIFQMTISAFWLLIKRVQIATDKHALSSAQCCIGASFQVFKQIVSLSWLHNSLGSLCFNFVGQMCTDVTFFFSNFTEHFLNQYIFTVQSITNLISPSLHNLTLNWALISVWRVFWEPHKYSFIKSHTLK